MSLFVFHALVTNSSDNINYAADYPCHQVSRKNSSSDSSQTAIKTKTDCKNRGRLNTIVESALWRVLSSMATIVTRCLFQMKETGPYHFVYSKGKEACYGYYSR